MYRNTEPTAIDISYWMDYAVQEYGLNTQYPYRYKTADKWAVGDKRVPGIYTDNIPYWNVTDYTWSPVPSDLGSGTITCGGYTVFAAQTVSPFTAYWKDTYSRVRQLRCSVPYYITYSVTKAGHFPAGLGLVVTDPCDTSVYCMTLIESDSSFWSTLSYISSDNAFNKIHNELGLGGSTTTVDSEWAAKPADTTVINERSLVVTNGKAHDSYVYDCATNIDVPTVLDHIYVDHYWRNITIDFKYQ